MTSKIIIILLICGAFAVGFIFALALCKAAKSADEASERWYADNVMKKEEETKTQKSDYDHLVF